MTETDKGDVEDLAKLVAAAQRAEEEARAAYQGIEPQAQATRDARAAVMWKAAQMIVADPSTAAEVATQVSYDGRLTSSTAAYIARDIAQSIEWHLRELLVEAIGGE